MSIRRKAGHTHARRGKRVLVLMNSDHHFVARYWERKSKQIKFLDHDPVGTNEVRTISYYQGGST